jgi:hypothetical protein
MGVELPDPEPELGQVSQPPHGVPASVAPWVQYRRLHLGRRKPVRTDRG